MSRTGALLPTLPGLALALAPGGCGSPGADARALPQTACITFESQPAGARFPVVDRPTASYAAFRESEVPLLFDLFERSDGLSTMGGCGRIDDRGRAGGSGKDLRLEQARLVVRISSAEGLTLRFAEGEGNVNLRVNDDTRNVEDLIALDRQVVGGIPVEIEAGPEGRSGTLRLEGPIRFFSIGGQELWLDDICLRAARPWPWSTR